MMLRWKSFFFFCWLLASPLALAEISLEEALHTPVGGDLADPSRQLAPAGVGGSIGSANDVCGAYRPSAASPGPRGTTGGAAPATASTAPTPSDPTLAQGGTFDLAKTKLSLIGANGTSGKCGRCHTGTGPGTAKLVLNDAAFSDPAKVNRMRAAIASGRMPQPAPSTFKDTAEGKAVVKFLESVR